MHRVGCAIAFQFAVVQVGVAQSTPPQLPTVSVGVARGGFAWMCETCGGGFPEGGWAASLSASLPTGHRLRPWLGTIRWTNPAEGFATITAGAVASVLPQAGLMLRMSTGLAVWSTPLLCLTDGAGCGGTSHKRALAGSIALGTLLPGHGDMRPVLWVGYDRSLGGIAGSGIYQKDMHLVSVGLGLAWAK